MDGVLKFTGHGICSGEISSILVSFIYNEVGVLSIIWFIFKCIVV